MYRQRLSWSKILARYLDNFDNERSKYIINIHMCYHVKRYLSFVFKRKILTEWYITIIYLQMSKFAQYLIDNDNFRKGISYLNLTNESYYNTYYFCF